MSVNGVRLEARQNKRIRDERSGPTNETKKRIKGQALQTNRDVLGSVWAAIFSRAYHVGLGTAYHVGWLHNGALPTHIFRLDRSLREWKHSRVRTEKRKSVHMRRCPLDFGLPSCIFGGICTFLGPANYGTVYVRFMVANSFRFVHTMLFQRSI